LWFFLSKPVPHGAGFFMPSSGGGEMRKALREEYIGLRLTKAECQKLEQYAEAVQETTSGALRRLLNNVVVISPNGQPDQAERSGTA
jgi:hypothetical protein